MLRLALFIGFSFLFLKCTSKPVAQNHILFIVDGMGQAHITGARLYKGGPEARLNLETLPYTGFVKTYSSNDFVTDSAASATALASGVKTYNHAIGVSDPTKESTGRSRSLTTILDRAQQAGKAIGLISTARITHATPAAYYAHVSHRDMEESIAAQLVTSKIDLIIGGGKKNFVGAKEGGSRKDQRDLLNEFRKKGYRVALSSKEFRSLNVKSKQKTIALLADDHLPYDLDRGDEVSLKELVDFAVQFLNQNRQGYILVVEVARIDHASHKNRARLAFSDMLAFDKALEKPLAEIVKDTLLIVTSDHETGGLALNGYAPYHLASGESLLRNKKGQSSPKTAHGLISWASGPGANSPARVPDKKKNFQHKAAYATFAAYHTAVDVPIMAQGPGAETFSGFINNNDIVHKVLEIMDLRPLKEP